MKNKKSIEVKREITSRVYRMSGELIPGFCAVCFKPVDIIINEDFAELFGICCKCGNILFYSHTPLIQINFEE